MIMTANRVSGHQTNEPQANERAEERIRRRTEASLAYHTNNPERIPQRLDELDAEWDIERALATGASGLTLMSLLFTVLRGGKWLLLGVGVQSVVMKHALGRRCATADLLRNLGLRMRREIDDERRQLESMLEDAGGPDESERGEGEGQEGGSGQSGDRRGQRSYAGAGGEGEGESRRQQQGSNRSD